MDEHLARMRRTYESTGLAEPDVAAHPIDQFRSWLHDAVTAGEIEPNAMVLATCGRDSQPHARNVLLKDIQPDGFVFFTNLSSRKALDMAANPRVSLCFTWLRLERQVNVWGVAHETTRDVTQSYWSTRPRSSQLGAWASFQSRVVSRDELDEALAHMDKKFPEDVPVPEFWGGYCVEPHSIEFWQGRVSRLHDRLRYYREGDVWKLERLAP